MNQVQKEIRLRELRDELWPEKKSEPLPVESPSTGSILVDDALEKLWHKAATTTRPGIQMDYEQDALDFERLCRKHGFIKL